MNQSISYSFLLNIIILFIFVCASIITGIFSYYRAFRANTIITHEIEKYEGFNCLSETSINAKLNGISYNVPFDVECKSNYGEPCMVDNNKNYAVVSYNIDHSDGTYVNSYSDARNEDWTNGVYKYFAMNTTYSCDMHSTAAGTGCTQTRKYRYGVYTYMYFDLPIISGLVRIPIYSKTNVMYEYRNIYFEDHYYRAYDSRFLPDDYLDFGNNNNHVNNNVFARDLLAEYVETLSGNIDNKNGLRFYESYNSRDNFKYYNFDSSVVEASYHLNCGNIIDYSKF